MLKGKARSPPPEISRTCRKWRYSGPGESRTTEAAKARKGPCARACPGGRARAPWSSHFPARSRISRYPFRSRIHCFCNATCASRASAPQQPGHISFTLTPYSAQNSFHPSGSQMAQSGSPQRARPAGNCSLRVCNFFRRFSAFFARRRCCLRFTRTQPPVQQHLFQGSPPETALVLALNAKHFSGATRPDTAPRSIPGSDRCTRQSN